MHHLGQSCRREAKLGAHVFSRIPSTLASVQVMTVLSDVQVYFVCPLALSHKCFAWFCELGLAVLGSFSVHTRGFG